MLMVKVSHLRRSRKIQWMVIVLLLLASMSLCEKDARAADPGVHVRVNIPDFPVTVDGIQVDSRTLEYPLLVYKDITYFPMTWNVGQGMGIRLSWSEEGGLTLSPFSGTKTKLDMETGGHFSANESYTASIANFPVTVETESIDNRAQTYPLLVFQDITYFPMTWHFAVDSFGWKTTWDDNNGFAIRTSQMPHLENVVYDDETSIYVTSSFQATNGMFRIAKDLTGDPVWLSKEEEDAIWQKMQDSEASLSLQPASDRDVQIDNNLITFEGVTLLSLQPTLDKMKEYYDNNPDEERQDRARVSARIYPLDDGNTLVSLRIYSYLHIPAPYTPHEDSLYFVANGKAEKLESFDQSIQSVKKTDSGNWVWSWSPEYMAARNGNARGEILWLGSDGNIRLWNDVLNVQFLAALDVEGDDMLALAYNLYGDGATSRPQGYFRLHQDGTYEKVKETAFDMNHPPSIPYTTKEHQLFVIDGNSVSNVLSGESRTWWDYELWEAAGRPPM
ncbi:hypothetical protein [Paenibacillus hexagrammi]|uniref:Copper amine oxidase-like N-terminal domain-containing protein n=1 Tax=Paenibacillus hexagrammi TaxID=2908839 RepID=A0ABY3SIT3_9BACL|nr:hypothetical protein [Paenibacillus sp. YPD9-1]UJF33634.1 hypothetical protein L0M14_29855 [Paenibacillus sp. YPD9-1]